MNITVDQIPVGFVRLDEQARIVATNPTCREWLGIPESQEGEIKLEDFLPRPSRVFFRTHVFDHLQLRGSVEEIYLPIGGTSAAGAQVLLNAIRTEVDGTTYYDCVLVRVFRRMQFEAELLRLRQTAQENANALKKTNEELMDVRSSLELREQQLIRLNTELAEAASRDALTGLFNRRELECQLNADLEIAHFRNQPYALILIDIDHFKNINDAFGHQEGDLVLQGISERMRTVIRASDEIARFGGEEFIVLLRNTDIEGAKMLAERLRVAVEELPVAGHDITISLGVAARFVDVEWTPDGLVAAADGALYDAKRSGRNMVKIAALNDL